MHIDVLGDSVAGISTSLWYKTKGVNLLIDAGDGATIFLYKKKFNFSLLDAVLISHSHIDHLYGLATLLYHISMAHQDASILVICPDEAEETVKSFIDKTGTENNVRVETPKPKSKIKIKRVTVEPFETEHTTQNYGYKIVEDKITCLNKEKIKEEGLTKELIEMVMKGIPVKVKGKLLNPENYFYETAGSKIVYTGDTKMFPELIEEVKEADLLICEATYLSEREEKALQYQHMTSKSAAEVAVKANVKRLMLIHRSARYSKEEIYGEAEKYFKDIIKW